MAARRTQQEALQTREAILDAAEWCFKTHGISATTVAMIAERAHCTRGAVYWHFPQPERMASLVLARGYPSLTKRLQVILDEKTPAVLPALQHALIHAIEDIESDAHMRAATAIMLYRCDFSRASGINLDTLRQEQQKILRLLQLVLARAAEKSELPSRSGVELHSKLIAYLWTGALKYCLQLPQEQSWQPHYSPVITETLQALRRPAPTAPTPCLQTT